MPTSVAEPGEPLAVPYVLHFIQPHNGGYQFTCLIDGALEVWLVTASNLRIENSSIEEAMWPLDKLPERDVEAITILIAVPKEIL